MSLRAVLWVAVSTQTQAADEKDSLPTQEADAKATCEEQGWRIIDICRVPGHSRRYIDIHECAKDMAREGITAFNQLLAHWDARDFDVLVVRDGTRFARTQSLHAYIVERTIEMGAFIHSLADGNIDQVNYRMWISMAGYAAAGEIDNLVKRRQDGFDARARRGLPVNAVVPESHLLIRDPNTGKALRLEIDESKRRLWLDLAELLLQGQAWRKIEQEMFKRGHTNRLGEQYQHHHFYRILHTPTFWGNMARHFKYKQRGPWIFEAGHEIPEGVTINYASHPAIYTGEVAEQVKAEMIRRWEAIKGKARPEQTGRFTGLFLCAECSYQMTYSRTPGYVALRCMSRYEASGSRASCSAKKYLSEKNAQNYVDGRLREMLTVGTPSAMFNGVESDPVPSASQRATLVEKEIAALEQQIRAMIRKQATAAESAYDFYEAEITAVSQQVRGLKTHLRELQRVASYEQNSARQNRAYEEVAALSIDGFWQLEDRRINQILHALMGGRRFVVQEGQVIGTAVAPKRKRRY